MGNPMRISAPTVFFKEGDQFVYSAGLGDPCPLLLEGQRYQIRREIASGEWSFGAPSQPEPASPAVSFTMSSTGTILVNFPKHGFGGGEMVFFVGDLPPGVSAYGVAYVNQVINSTLIELGDGFIPLRYPTVTFTIANPGVVNLANHGLQVGQSVRFGSTGTLPTPLVANLPYQVQSVTGASTFTVSSGGAALQFSGTPTGTAAINTASKAQEGFGSLAFTRNGTTTQMFRSVATGIFLEAAGTRTVQMSNGDAVTFANLPANRVIPIQARTVEDGTVAIGLH